MRTDDLLTLCSHPQAKSVRAFEGRNTLVVAVLAAVFLAVVLVQTCTPSAQAVVPQTQAESRSLSNPLDRGGFASLPSLF
jgi:hypothetical protein